MFNLVKFYSHLFSRTFYRRIHNFSICMENSLKKNDLGERHIKAILKRIALLIRKFRCDLIFLLMSAHT
jgi:hypothetical protein